MKKQETRKTGVKVEVGSLTALTWAREGNREKVKPSVETVITPSNVLILSELISMQALRSIIPYTGKLFIQMQRSLYKDIFRRTDIHHQLSEGYDLIQTAACFLCGYMGKKITDEIIHKGKKMTIKNACYNVINSYLYNMETMLNNQTYIPYKMEEEIPCIEEAESEEQFDKAERLIRKMHLTKGEKEVLNCYMQKVGPVKTAKLLKVNRSTIWRRRQSMQRKYLKIAGCFI